MADLSLGIVERVIKIGLAIKKAAVTARQNKKECRDIEKCVTEVRPLLELLNEATEPIRHPVISGMLEDLAESLDEALKLITDCQESSAMRRFLTAGDMAKQLRRVQEDIQRKLELGNFASTVQIIFILTNPIRYAGGGLPLHTQLPDAGEVEISSTSLSSVGDARSGANSEVTVEATGNEVSYTPFSGLESTSPELGATMRQFSELNVNENCMKQKLVIRIDMTCERSRSKALSLVAKMSGVESMGVIGDGEDRLELVGRGMDPVRLLCCLRKKIGFAEILMVEQVKVTWHPRPGTSTSPEAPSPQPVKHTDTPVPASVTDSADQDEEHARTSPRRATADDCFGRPADPLHLQRQPASARQRQGRTFNMSRTTRLAQKTRTKKLMRSKAFSIV